MAVESWTCLSELIDRARNGNADALAALLQNYRSYLALLARVQIGQRLQGRVSPSDVVRDTFLWAKRAFPEFRGTTETELTAWLRKIRVAIGHRGASSSQQASRRPVGTTVS